jgi:hypothetical protein
MTLRELSFFLFTLPMLTIGLTNKKSRHVMNIPAPWSFGLQLVDRPQSVTNRLRLLIDYFLRSFPVDTVRGQLRELVVGGFFFGERRAEQIGYLLLPHILSQL